MKPSPGSVWRQKGKAYSDVVGGRARLALCDVRGKVWTVASLRTA
jgi:hypothetical protein